MGIFFFLYSVVTFYNYKKLMDFQDEKEKREKENRGNLGTSEEKDFNSKKNLYNLWAFCVLIYAVWILCGLVFTFNWFLFAGILLFGFLSTLISRIFNSSIRRKIKHAMYIFDIALIFLILVNAYQFHCHFNQVWQLLK
jgi:hypothetical protein